MAISSQVARVQNTNIFLPRVTRSRSQRTQSQAMAPREARDVSHEIPFEQLCKVCMGQRKAFALLPCGHANLCQDCAKLAKRDKKCFTCRVKVKGILKLFDN